MKLEDISKWDLSHIKETALKILVDRDIQDPSHAVIAATLSYIESKGMMIVKDPNRECTLSSPKGSWYAPKPVRRY